MQEEFSQSETIERMKASISRMKEGSGFLKRRDLKSYEEFFIALESAEFYLDRLSIVEAAEEIDRAIKIVKTG